ncbi:hypothetical protein [Sorangium cellulosum]|uniref:Uncharacterized protein n=1 Tax=Sorangium cellulosum TaxID=56 RepID=A0A150R0N2_SORCE|nr:hypothetical protein [Sorangium cellulosum]KYF73752.1 hypothetical protein BE15_47520 [Sorangium cellulosum]
MERLGLGIIIGVGLASLTRITRPTVKRAMRLGFVAFESVKSALGEGRERLADLVAEVRDEMARQQQSADAASAGVRVEMDPPAR